MQNDDKRLQQLFEDYHPALDSDDRFMRRVRQQLAVVDMLRREQAALKARSRKAIAAAAVAGFVAGVTFTIMLPYVGSLAAHIHSLIPLLDYDMISQALNVLTWLIVGVTSVAVALNTYETVMAHTARKHG